MGDLKIYDLGEYRCKYNLDTFVETGTFRGEGVEYASKFGFDNIHSVEAVESLASDAEKMFTDKSNIKIHHGESFEVLEKILPQIESNILFWLDAHFPGADAHLVPYDNETDPDKRAPLERELKLIKERVKTNNDVLIIDDLWLYEDGPFEWGSCDAHFKKCGFNVTRAQLVEKDSSFIYEMFEKTHNIEKSYKHQGYLIMTPKDK